MSDQDPSSPPPVSFTPEQRRNFRGSVEARGDSQTRAGLGGTWEHRDSGTSLSAMRVQFWHIAREVCPSAFEDLRDRALQPMRELLE